MALLDLQMMQTPDEADLPDSVASLLLCNSNVSLTVCL